MIANVEDCTVYISGAGMNCFNYASGGIVYDIDALDTVRGDLDGFAANVSPFWVQMLNGFITPITSTWTSIIEGATVIIEAIKAALSNPRKLQVAINKIVGMATDIVNNIRAIINAVLEFPGTVRNFLLKELDDARAALDAYVETLEERAVAKCIEVRDALVAKLEARVTAMEAGVRRDRLLTKLEEVRTRECGNLVTISDGASFEWPGFPDLVFGLGTVLQNIINALDFKLPVINIKQPHWDNKVLVNSGVMDAKVESIAAWANNKVDSVNEFIKPFVASYNAIAEFLNLLLSMNLKGILKWLLKLPATIVRVHLGAAEFAVRFMAGLAEMDPLAAIKDWATEKFAGVAAKIKERAERYGVPNMDSYDTEFIDEVVAFIKAMPGNIAEYVREKYESIGSAFGAVVKLACQFYGFLVGGVSYCINVITAGAAPLLGMLGIASSILAPPIATSPDPADPQTREPAPNDVENYVTVYFQENADGVMVEVTPPVSGVTVPYGYFYVNSAGELVLDDDGLPLRAGGTAGALFPLIDPEAQSKSARPDISAWTRLSSVATTSVPILNVLNDDTSVVGVATTRIYEYWTFKEMPGFGAPPANSGVDTDGIDVVEGLSSVNSIPVITELYQGSFVYMRTFTYNEVPNGSDLTFRLVMHRGPVSNHEVLETSSGYYSYSAFNDGLVLNVIEQSLYTGPIQEDYPSVGADVGYLPYSSVVGATLYRGDGTIYNQSLVYGKLYSGISYRLGLFDSGSPVLFFPPPEDGAPNAYRTYNVPAHYVLNIPGDAGVSTTLGGGAEFEAMDVVEFVTTSGVSTVHARDHVFTSVRLYAKTASGFQEYVHTKDPIKNVWTSSVSVADEYYYYMVPLSFYGRENDLLSIDN